MYCSLTRSQSFPMAIRVSLQQNTFKNCLHLSKSSYLPVKFHVNSKGSAFRDVSTGLVISRLKSMKIGMLKKPESVREFSSFDSQRFGKRSSGISRGKYRLESKAFRDKRSGGNGRSSSWEKPTGDSIWVKSDEKPSEERFQRANRSSYEKRDGRNDDRRSRFRGNGETRNRDSFRARGNGRITEVEEESKKGSGNSIWVANDSKPEKEQLSRVNRSSWEKQDDRTRDQKSFRARGDDRISEEEEEDEEETRNNVHEDDDGAVEEEPNDTRWSEIKNRFNRFDVRDQGRDNTAYRNWNRQESWGRKTWQEATESSVPRLEGEVVYGVSPVLAALSAGRREFYALYVQEGLDLSSNNRKKKDKKGFEKVLKLAEKLELNIKETSKHDLNMVSDNRPHQGLVLDASPLELVKVKELDPVTSEDNSSLWVALDEVTDPQNLGAIIRSAYFFGATGVVVCAKNSAPLSAVVSKASAGSLEVMELRYCKNMMQFLESSAENGWRVVGGSVSSKAVALNEVLPGSPTVLVLGNEGTGLRPLVERSCTDLVRISGNMPNDVVSIESDDAEGEGFRPFLAVESLNVSVAAGLFLHHLIGNKSSV